MFLVTFLMRNYSNPDWKVRVFFGVCTGEEDVWLNTNLFPLPCYHKLTLRFPTYSEEEEVGFLHCAPQWRESLILD